MKMTKLSEAKVEKNNYGVLYIYLSSTEIEENVHSQIGIELHLKKHFLHVGGNNSLTNPLRQMLHILENVFFFI